MTDLAQRSDLLIPIAIVTVICIILYVLIMTRHRERMYLLEKGLEPDMFARVQTGKWNTLKIGMLLTGLSLGVVFGALLEKYQVTGPAVGPIIMLLLFGGLSLVANFWLENKWRK